jgi:hypothetical protein
MAQDSTIGDLRDLAYHFSPDMIRPWVQAAAAASRPEESGSLLAEWPWASDWRADCHLEDVSELTGVTSPKHVTQEHITQADVAQGG